MSLGLNIRHVPVPVVRLLALIGFMGIVWISFSNANKGERRNEVLFLEERRMDTTLPPHVNTSNGSGCWLDDELTVKLCTTGDILEHVHYPTRTIPIHQVSPDEYPEIMNDREKAFIKIFRHGAWSISQTEYGEVRSGPGSVPSHTVIVRQVLRSVLEQLRMYYKKRVIKVLDVACGDFTWMNKFLETEPDVDYTGMDIVPDLIQKHRKRFSNVTRWRFRQGDIVNKPLEETYDLIFSRDMIIHLSNHDIIRTLQHMSQSQNGFILLTHYPLLQSNIEIKKIRFRSVNLMLPPYSLVRPLCFNEENFRSKFSTLWRLPLKQNASQILG